MMLDADSVAHEINNLGATDTQKALRLYQQYICQALKADAVTWCALYKGPYGKDVWHTIVMDDWKVFDIVFPKGVLLDPQDIKAKYYAKARKEGGLSPGVKLAMSNVGSTRAHLISEYLTIEEWQSHWEYAWFRKQGIGDRMAGAYSLSDLSESHVWVDRGIDSPIFSPDDRTLMIEIMNRFPRLHRWLMLERGLLEPAGKPLSPRQKDVLNLLLGPWTEAQIAEKLELTQGTVHNYIIEIYKIFSVSGRHQLIQLWLN